MNVLTDADNKPEQIQGKKIAIIGYGSQGCAHALNLQDSGCDVVVGLREDSPSFKKVLKDNIAVKDIRSAVEDSDIIVVLTPDETHAELYKHDIEPYLKSGAALGFAHGLTIHFGLIKPRSDLDVFMVAPKAAGYAVRALYEQGGGAMAMMAVAQDKSDHARDLALAYACALGCGRSGVIETTFKEECEADLFGEQAVLVGGISALLRAGYNTLVDAGFSPEVAYIECVHEAKIIMDLIYGHGLAQMQTMISNTAEYGGYVAGNNIIGSEVKAEMDKTLKSIQDGSFVKGYLGGNKKGLSDLPGYRSRYAGDSIEVAGRNVRALASGIKFNVTHNSNKE